MTNCFKYVCLIKKSIVCHTSANRDTDVQMITPFLAVIKTVSFEALPNILIRLTPQLSLIYPTAVFHMVKRSDNSSTNYRATVVC